MTESSEMATDPREAYFSQARSWAQDREAARARSIRVAWTTAAVAGGIAAVEALALLGLAPLKTVVPYTLMVDRTTGYVQALEGTQIPSIKEDSALTQSLLAQYVQARESFDINSISDQYRKVALWSADAARTAYISQMQDSNLQSPLRRFPRSAVVSTRVRSVSAIGVQTAMVRFMTERRDNAQGAPQSEYWVAVIRFRFSGEPMAIADRLVNPLGFQVVSYRKDQETAPPVENEQVAQPGYRAVPAVPGGPDPVTSYSTQTDAYGLPPQVTEQGSGQVSRPDTAPAVRQVPRSAMSSSTSAPLTTPGSSSLPFGGRRSTVNPDVARGGAQ